ncbi:MAG: metalloprotease family protein [Candidatus Omnitrophica bacterium]|nr:metalloprotease family protein [Candidatus Omnitrophota bacterium]
MLIPGYIIAWLTFPGVIVHELAHKLFCNWTKTPVRQVRYFQFKNPAGFVVHDFPSSVWKHILIGIGPFLINTGTGLCIGLLAASFKKILFLQAVLSWLAISIAMHSFPSVGDARGIWEAVWAKGTPIPARLVGTPLVALIFLGAIGSFFWLDLLYGIAVVLFIPKSMGIY